MYYKSIIEQELYSIVATSDDKKIPRMPYWYQLISKNHYEDLKKEKPIIEADLKRFDFPLLWGEDKKYFLIYNYYYLQMVHEIVNKLPCSYKWINLHEWKEKFPSFVLDEERLISSMQGDSGNAYLERTLANRPTLGRDILRNGMYFPFFYQRQGNKEMPLFGSHRIYSLLACLKPEDDIKFLCIDFTRFVTYYYHLDVTKDKAQFLKRMNFSEKMPCFTVDRFIDDSAVYKTLSNNQQICWEYFRCFNDTLGTRMFENRHLVKPNPVFNDEKAWEKFIKSPFNVQADLEKFC